MEGYDQRSGLLLLHHLPRSYFEYSQGHVYVSVIEAQYLFAEHRSGILAIEIHIVQS